MRALIAALVLASAPALALADDAPALSADGSRLELREASYKLCGGQSTTVFCAAGAEVDDTCTRHVVRNGCDRRDDDDLTGATDTTAATEKAIAETERAGGFKPVPVIALHRIVVHEMLGPQEITRSRVIRSSGGLTFSVAAGAKLSASITVTRGKTRIAFARWSCESYGGDQTAITRAAIVGATVYAELTCSTYHRWLRVNLQ